MKEINKLFIGGEWVESASGRMIEVVDPATEEVWARVPEGNGEDIDRAVKAARQAFDKGPWRRMSTYERAELMREMASLLKSNAEFLGEIESRETGKPVHRTKQDATGLHQWWHYYAGMADKIQGETIPFEDDKHIFTVREPLGVVGAITAWNAPLQLITMKLSMALAAGNTVVLKPAETTPVNAFEIAKLVEKVGFPPGVINVVPGYGESAGQRLTSHPDVDKISFTGDSATARKIMRAATGNLKKLNFELGGKSPQIIFPDANFDSAFESAVSHGFDYTGQACTLGSRVLVHEDLYDKFLERFKERAEQIKVGNPLEKVDIGPQANKQQLEKTLNYIKIGQKEGARLVAGGNRPSVDKGYYVNPTVFADVNPEMRIAQEEIFGPVVTVIPFSTEQEAIDIANNVSYGLSAGVWTKNLARGHRMAKELRAGTVWLNTFRYVRWVAPYGGYKASGWGRENGTEAMKEFTQVKTVMVDLNE
ncbi:aldehyde dehydrogenase [Salinibacillus xinjiangensis]|uniref:Aldehyde dehydrogenase family protein n=1 Tax=Salinibacillus xinjiangensis TaxID=1229268 RepID=A0A6G1X216_9BACI|nr:aldehyde dehydrogenase [Salinibacillus xinjiangensis]MRG84868.1 aldehyde dehydrogenase family protein [Salinibacillus xinjiangensis]